MIRFALSMLGAAVLVTGCSSIVDGSPNAAAGSHISSRFPSNTGSSSSPTSWVDYRDPVTRLRFQLPGSVSVTVASDKTSDGISLTRRSYRYITSTGTLVSVSTTSPVDPSHRIAWSLDKYVEKLPANVDGNGFTDVTVVERQAISQAGHIGTQFRVLATSADTGATSAWLVRAVVDGSMLVIMQVVYVGPDPADALSEVHALHARLVSKVVLP